MIEANQVLAEAYRNLDRTKKRLRTVKNLVFEENEDGKQREELGDDNWLKL